MDHNQLYWYARNVLYVSYCVLSWIPSCTTDHRWKVLGPEILNVELFLTLRSHSSELLPPKILSYFSSAKKELANPPQENIRKPLIAILAPNIGSRNTDKCHLWFCLLPRVPPIDVYQLIWRASGLSPVFPKTSLCFRSWNLELKLLSSISLPPICPYTNPPIYQSVLMPIHPSTNPFTYQSVHLLIHPYTNPPIYQSAHIPTRQSTTQHIYK